MVKETSTRNVVGKTGVLTTWQKAASEVTGMHGHAIVAVYKHALCVTRP